MRHFCESGLSRLVPVFVADLSISKLQVGAMTGSITCSTNIAAKRFVHWLLDRLVPIFAADLSISKLRVRTMTNDHINLYSARVM